MKSQNTNSPTVKPALANKQKPAAPADADEYEGDTFENNPIDDDQPGLPPVESNSKPSKKKP